MNSTAFSRELMSVIARDVCWHQEERTVEEICAKLEEVRTRFLTLAGVSDELKVEANRIVFTQKFKLLIQRDPPYAEALRLLEDVTRLGFSDFLEEGTVAIFQAMYCIRQGRLGEARQALERVLSQTENPSQGPARVRRSLERDARRWLAFCSPSQVE